MSTFEPPKKLNLPPVKSKSGYGPAVYKLNSP